MLPLRFAVTILVTLAITTTFCTSILEPKPRRGCYDTDNQPLCCQDKNNTCTAFGPQTGDSLSDICYCDSECSKLNDCCVGYGDVCNSVDCVLEDNWGQFSECDTRCGWGKKTRTKRILVQPRNGGAECPRNKESVICYDTNCKAPR